MHTNQMPAPTQMTQFQIQRNRSNSTERERRGEFEPFRPSISMGNVRLLAEKLDELRISGMRCGFRNISMPLTDRAARVKEELLTTDGLILGMLLRGSVSGLQNLTRWLSFSPHCQQREFIFICRRSVCHRQLNCCLATNTTPQMYSWWFLEIQTISLQELITFNSTEFGICFF